LEAAIGAMRSELESGHKAEAEAREARWRKTVDEMQVEADANLRAVEQARQQDAERAEGEKKRITDALDERVEAERVRAAAELSAGLKAAALEKLELERTISSMDAAHQATRDAAVAERAAVEADAVRRVAVAREEAAWEAPGLGAAEFG